MIEVIDLPGGWVVTPFLGVRLSLAVFYLVAPAVVLVLQSYFLTAKAHHEISKLPFSAFITIVAEWLPAALLVLILWKFVPYAGSRPEGWSLVFTRWLMPYYHCLAVLCA